MKEREREEEVREKRFKRERENCSKLHYNFKLAINTNSQAEVLRQILEEKKRAKHEWEGEKERKRERKKEMVCF